MKRAKLIDKIKDHKEVVSNKMNERYAGCLEVCADFASRLKQLHQINSDNSKLI